MKDLLIGVLLGAISVLMIAGFVEMRRLDAMKQDKHKIIIVRYHNG